ncbi:retrovirus-related pol polyprotein from transposon TNT 1-94 [Tanacetum coccineum]|uniref:Retrovirus-related pol polyprotein from transposon TNT 1-94 n=1 Tax=Tanacetum coccineum TaxID=301880 RepID=A0ABQ5DJV5_9ASTR
MDLRIHPIANVIEDFLIAVSKRKELDTDANVVLLLKHSLTSVEPRTFKTSNDRKHSWMMHARRIHEIERLEIRLGSLLKDSGKKKELTSRKSFAPVARIEAIRIFVANALTRNMTFYKMVVNNAFLECAGAPPNEETKRSCSQPEGFVDKDNPTHVYKLKKALYGLKQAPRAWYDMLSSFLISQQFSKGLQISQSPRGIFINQSKYAYEIVKKYGLHSIDSVDTTMIENKKLDEDLQGKQVDATLYRGHGVDPNVFYMPVLVPKDNRFDIKKYNGRIPHGFSPREPIFQVTLDAIALTPCYPAFLITADVPEVLLTSLNDVVVDQMHQPWRTFAALINRSLSGKTSGLDKLRLSRAQIIWEKDTLSWRNKIGMRTLKDDYLINTLRFLSRKESSHIYGVVLPECLTTPEMKESKAYKTYLGYMKNLSQKANKLRDLTRSLQLSQQQVSSSESLRWKIKSKGKEKEKKSLRDFHKTYPSGSGIVIEKPPGVEKITPTVISEGTGDKPGVPDVTKKMTLLRVNLSLGVMMIGKDKQQLNKRQQRMRPCGQGNETNESENDEIESDEDREWIVILPTNLMMCRRRLDGPLKLVKEDLFMGEGADVEMIDA